MHVDIGNPSLSWALSSGWPSLNSPRNPKPRDPEPPNIKGAKENLWQSVMGSWVRGQQTIAPSFFAGCFLVTSWLNWQLELYPWHSVVWSPSVLSPLHCSWSSIGKSSIFFSSLPYRLHGPWNSHLSLSTLFVNALQKETFREGISCFFSCKPCSLSLSLYCRRLSCQGLQPHFTRRCCPHVDIIRSALLAGKKSSAPLQRYCSTVCHTDSGVNYCLEWPHCLVIGVRGTLPPWHRQQTRAQEGKCIPYIMHI